MEEDLVKHSHLANCRRSNLVGIIQMLLVCSFVHMVHELTKAVQIICN